MSPAGRALRKFPHNTPLELVGGIYVRKLLGRKPQAVIDVKFENHPVTTVPIELTGELVPGSRFQDKKRIPAVGNVRRNIVVKNVSNAYVDETGSYWHRIEVEQGNSVVVSSLELARVLFFHSPHLVRSSLRPNGLGSLAQVRFSDKEIDIQFSELSDFPASQLNNKRIRQHLAWLFLSDAARKSYGSILNHWQQGAGEKWEFHFSPPPMIGWSLTVSASGDENKKLTEKITEICSVYVSDFWVKQLVFFNHPNLKKRVELDGQQEGNRTHSPKDDQAELDIPSVPGYGRALHNEDDAHLIFNLPQGLITEVENGKTSPTGNGVSDENFEPQSIGAGSTDSEGQSQELNYRLNQGHDTDTEMQEQVEQKPTERFSNFEKVILRLVAENDYKLQSKLKSYIFPKPKTRSKVVFRTEKKNSYPILSGYP